MLRDQHGKLSQPAVWSLLAIEGISVVALSIVASRDKAPGYDLFTSEELREHFDLIAPCRNLYDQLTTTSHADAGFNALREKFAEECSDVSLSILIHDPNDMNWRPSSDQED